MIQIKVYSFLKCVQNLHLLVSCCVAILVTFLLLKAAKKKAPAKKPPAKKPPAKKTPAKKTPAKKTPAKKAPAKKAPAKKAPAKKAPAKKAPAKKAPAPKKADSKKSSTKKSKAPKSSKKTDKKKALPKVGKTCKVNNKSGKCVDIKKSKCNSATSVAHKNACSGTNVRCCVPKKANTKNKATKPAVGKTCTKSGYTGGKCMAKKASCKGKKVALTGVCAGTAVCCATKKKANNGTSYVHTSSVVFSVKTLIEKPTLASNFYTCLATHPLS